MTWTDPSARSGDASAPPGLAQEEHLCKGTFVFSDYSTVHARGCVHPTCIHGPVSFSSRCSKSSAPHSHVSHLGVSRQPRASPGLRVGTGHHDPLFGASLRDSRGGAGFLAPFPGHFQVLCTFLWEKPLAWTRWCRMRKNEAREGRNTTATFLGRELVLHLAVL